MKSFLPFLWLAAACGGMNDATPQAIPGQPVPPPSAVDATPASTTTVTYAISGLWLGDVTPNDPSDETNTAWRSFGYDLDQRTTTKDSVGVCTLGDGVTKLNQADGDFGIDNNWGSLILPILETAADLPSISLTMSDAIAKGAPTIEIEVTGLPDDPAASAVGLEAHAFGGAAVTGDPFDASVPRPVVASSTIDGATVASGARVSFATAYVTRGTFVGRGSGAPLVLEIPIAPQPLELVVKDPIVTFERSSDPSTVSGTLAGVLDTEALVASGRAIAPFLVPAVCTDPTDYDFIAQQIREARDILDDGTNASGTPCTGISIGIGFTAKRIANPTDVVPDPKPIAPCD
ncbi:MAG TPA: hypothetical protein VGH28_15485 [Polyangiaceae bacterium]